MRALILPLALAGCALWSGAARADQCQMLDEAAARSAEAILAKQPKVIAFCEPCGDKAPGVPTVARTVSIASVGGGDPQILVNGEPVDLAYLFVQTSTSRYHNLAKLAGCPATGVSASLAIEEDAPLELASPPVEPPPAVQARSTEPATMTAAPFVVHVHTPSTPAFPAMAVVLACFAGFVAGALGLLAAAMLRQRRALRPRAIDLRPPT